MVTSIGPTFLQAVERGNPAMAAAAARSLEALEADLTRLHQVGADTWKPVALDRETFASHLGSCLASAAGDDAVGALSALHATDLYLACAAGRGVPAAAELLALHFLRPIAGSLQAIAGGEGFIEEVRQRLYERLLVAGADGPPRILQYAGRSSLATWLGVAAQRLALTLLRAEGARRRTTERAAEEPLSMDLDPELRYLKERYRDDFKAAVTVAMARLAPRDRTVLRLHAVGGLTQAKIAAMFGVDESTISRWVQRAKDAVLFDTQRELGARLGIRIAEVPSLVRLVSSQVDLSLARLLDDGQKR
jgi:RNA polymerase sigma-70 factor, ECF subfamily